MKSFNKFVHWFVLVFVSLFLIQPTLAQERKRHRSEAGGKGYFLLSFGKLDLGSLNSRLKGKNFPEFKESFVSLGGGGHAIIGKLIIGGEGEGHIITETTTDALKTPWKSAMVFSTLATCFYHQKIYKCIRF
jgi:surface polysaccharide O-acyltransferase-like enzyme